MDTVIDYSEAFPRALLAQGKGANVLILTRLNEPTRARFDGKRAQFELEYRWLSRTCGHPKDEAWACARGTEITFWQRREIGPPFFERLKAGTASLFDTFNLF